MPVTYEEIIHTDLGCLKTASTAWKEMGDKFNTLHDDYRDHVKAAVRADTWNGESAVSYGNQANLTLQEYTGARDEAHAVAGLLEDAHQILKKCKEHVENERDAARKACMIVSSNGRCTMDLEKVREKKGEKRAEGYRRDHVARQETEDAWTERINEAVKATQRADHNIKLALLTDPRDQKGVPGGFNSALKGDVGETNAARAGDLLKDVRDGHKPSPAHARELKFLMQENGKDVEFSRTLINSVGGPDGLIRAHNELDDISHSGDKKHNKSYLTLDKGLATVLATATRDPRSDFYDKFRKDMKKAGLKKYDLDLAAEKITTGTGHNQQVRGYQSLVSLMKQGGEYDKDFLQDTADDIRRAEDRSQGGNPDVWDLRGDFGKSDGRFAHDPLDGILEVMSRNPEASTEYLDPKPDNDPHDRDDNLEYLAKKRDWKLVDHSRWQGNVEITGQDSEETDAWKGLALAIEAGATGERPLGEGDHPRTGAQHSAAEARVLDGSLIYLDPKENGDPLPKSMHNPLANALADYAHDTHRTLDPTNSVRDNLGVYGSEGDAHLSASPDRLIRVMRGVSDSPEAFTVLHQAEREQIREDVLSLPENAKKKDIDQAMSHAGRSMGTFEAIRQDHTLDLRDQKLSDADWNQQVKYNVIAGTLAPIPNVADIPTRAAYFWTWEEAKDTKTAATNEAAAEMTRQWLSSDTQVRHMVDDWAKTRGMDPDDATASNLKGDVLQERDSGRREARRALGREE